MTDQASREIALAASFLVDGVMAPDGLDGLDGVAGSNRAKREAQIAARNDLEAIRSWLLMFKDSPDTHRAYSKEADRLLLWAIRERRAAFSSLAAEDIHAYFVFLSNPPANWVSDARAARTSPDWRPLRGPLKESSLRQAKTIINALFTWLVHAGYLAGNPCALVRSRRTKASLRVERYVKRDEWLFLRSWLAELPEESLAARRERDRHAHLCALLYLTAARLSDVAEARMGHFFRREDGSWWWRVVGKGRKESFLPATDELMDSLSVYRQSFELSALPSPGERAPLVMRLSGPKPGAPLLSANMIGRAVKGMFEKAAAAAADQGQDAIAAGLRRATTHWMRHTSITHQLEGGVPLVTVRDNARHASIATTSRYLWKEDQERHAETNAKLRLGPSGPSKS